MIIYYLANLITEDEITANKELISKILANELHTPQIKRLTGITFQGQPVYRAKIDEKNRLIFMRIMHAGKPALLLLNQNDHDYKELARKLSSTNTRKINSFELDSAPTVSLSNEPEEQFLPVTFYQEQVFFLDEDQQKATNCTAPLLLSGPPGAGKTLVIYDLLCNYVVNNAPMHLAREELGYGQKILFISQSANLTKKLHQQYAQEKEQGLPVDFLTWEQILQAQNPNSTPLPKNAFADWLKNNFPQGNPEIIHYEMSLVAALGNDEYLKLGKRECYLSGRAKEQKKVINLLTSWRNHLKTKQWLDPLITEISISGYGANFCDESQNFSPVALACLVRAVSASKQFFACIDPEQALYSWPYARNCLLNLLTKQYKDYQTFILNKTWRCASLIAEIANHVMNTKHDLDGNQAKREYSALESHLPSGSGLVEIINREQLQLLKPRGNLAETVIIIFSPLTPVERAKIQSETGSSNILTPAEAIGLDFNTVVLWMPIATQKLLQKLSSKKNGLDLEEWKALNELYIAITRARQELFIYEPELKRFSPQLTLLFGNLQSTNNIPEALIDTDNERKWLEQVDYHLEKGQLEAATVILKNHLNYDDALIAARISPPAIPPVESSTKEELKPSIEEIKPPTAKVNKKRNRGKPAPTNIKMPPAKPALAVSNFFKNTTVKKQMIIEKDLQKMIPLRDVLNEFLTLEDQRKYFIKYMVHTNREVRTQFKDIVIQNWGALKHDQLFNCIFSNELMYKAADYEESRCIMNKLFIEFLSDLEQQMLLAKMLPETNQDMSITYQSAFLLFCASRDGCQYLNAWFTRNPKLLPLISVGHLDDPSFPKITEEQFMNPSLIVQPDTPLRMLVRTDSGQALLLEHFFQPAILKKLKSHNIYFSIKPKMAPKIIPPQPPFYYLIQTSTGLKILNKIFEENPSLAQRPCVHRTIFFLDYIFQIIPEANITNISPFFTLCTLEDGRKLLHTWFLDSLRDASITNPSGINFVETFTVLIPKKHQKFANTSCIHHLCTDETGQKVLAMIIESFPAIANKLNTILLTRAGLEVFIVGGTTPIQILSSTEYGISLISQWLGNSEEFARALTASDFAESRNKLHAPLFHNLCKSNEGCKILYQWLQFNPGLIASLSDQNSFSTVKLNDTAEGKRVIELLKDSVLFKRLLNHGTEILKAIDKTNMVFFKNENAQEHDDPKNTEDRSAKSMLQ